MQNSFGTHSALHTTHIRQRTKIYQQNISVCVSNISLPPSLCNLFFFKLEFLFSFYITYIFSNKFILIISLKHYCVPAYILCQYMLYSIQEEEEEGRQGWFLNMKGLFKKYPGPKSRDCSSNIILYVHIFVQRISFYHLKIKIQENRSSFGKVKRSQKVTS